VRLSIDRMIGPGDFTLPEDPIELECTDCGWLGHPNERITIRTRWGDESGCPDCGGTNFESNR